MLTWTCTWLMLWTLSEGPASLFAQAVDKPRGPWRLAFKVISGNWDAATMGHATFWELLTSDDVYSSGDAVQDQHDFSTSGDHFKSPLVQQWEDGYISVQAIKLSLFKAGMERAWIVFDGVGRTKTTWFKCSNILHASYPDLPDTSLTEECPGRSVMGYPMTMMRQSYWEVPCTQTTGWLLVTDANLGFRPCPDYITDDPPPYFRFSNVSGVADLTTQLESADSLAIFFQVWDQVFKGIEGVKPSVGGFTNLTGLFLSEHVENDAAGSAVRNLLHTQASLTYKSEVVNIWSDYHIDMVKFSMLRTGIEKAWVVFSGVNADRENWFSSDNILYSSFGDPLDGAANLDVCSLVGDSYRNWQVALYADPGGCSIAEQAGWMLVKEPRNNGTCSWDTNFIKKKPYFMYNTYVAADIPVNFQFADVISVFVHGWRVMLKVAAGGSLGHKASVYALWTESGALNDDVTDAASLSTTIAFKSPVVDQWENSFIRAVKMAAYKDGLEVWSAVFDATGSSSNSWLACGRLLYASATDLDAAFAISQAYTCSVAGASSTFRFFLGTGADCGTVAAAGVFALVDTDSTCSSRVDLPQFMFSTTTGTGLSETGDLADMFAILVDMDNCNGEVCKNGATCEDLGGNFRCFCAGDYYGTTCANLDGTHGSWSEWGSCSVTCESGVVARSRDCIGAVGSGTCPAVSVETNPCSLGPCPIDGGFNSWSSWDTCTATCDDGTQSRSRTCTNPEPQYGGLDCVGDSTESQTCNDGYCPVDGGYTLWSSWNACSVTCGDGTQSRSRTCTSPEPQYGGLECIGVSTGSQSCNDGQCPIDGGYTLWSVWDGCSATCGDGIQSRSRSCTNPEPQYGGLDCVGDSTEFQPCNDGPCPVEGGYTVWSSWDACSMTCGDGTQSRSRTCTSPEPQHGGLDCIGDSSESLSCNDGPCPIDGSYTLWSIWDVCSVTCGDGTQSRSRTCTNPEPQYGGLDCVGDFTESQLCNDRPCPSQ
ncbi:HMCN1-like protein [Mya arenaria]|uniref:HMCN1-like protein n=1 Tax=Mya arenaria TaxID=6604 RepID=A0ABY7F9G7_MYAAR|nr:HMCN1-like protein [Mya arenaria]